MKYIKSDVIWIVLREVQSSFAETGVKDKQFFCDYELSRLGK